MSFTNSVWKSSRWSIGLAAFVLALTFAAFTDIRWEDYYITFRASRNLAEGHGLVFNVGDRLHTFTSPLGVLLPAACYLLTGSHSDEAALWLFRFVSAAAFGCAAALLYDIARERRYGWAASALVLICAVVDTKSLAFTVSGMETAFMLLFVAWTVRLLLTQSEPSPRSLGLAWAGLIWTRPDGCVYIGVLSAAMLLCKPAEAPGTRAPVISTRLRMLAYAGTICAVIYLPWFLFAWSYYGSPVPHTIVAKGLMSPHRSIFGLVRYLLAFPLLALRGETPIADGWLPQYFGIGGWPMTLLQPARLAGLVAMFVWLAPFVRWDVRATSLSFAALIVYLGYFAGFAFPWYVPPVHWLELLTLGGLVQQAWNAAARLRNGGIGETAVRQLRGTLVCGATLCAAAVIVLCAAGAYQLRMAQRLVEEGVRKPIGLWLKEHARAGDTVAMEPLGYIGYYSGLKTYDFVGLSSREVTAAKRKGCRTTSALLREVRPTWIVLRPIEVERVNGEDPSLLRDRYRQVETFDNLEQIGRHSFPGRAYLEFDARFVIFHAVAS